MYRQGSTLAAISKKTGHDAHYMSTILQDAGINVLSGQEMTRKTYGRTIQMIDPKTDKVVKTFETQEETGRYINKIGLSNSVRPATNIRRACGSPNRTAFGFKWFYL